MYLIKTEGEGRAFQCALHFAVVEKDGYGLHAASFAGFPSATWAVDAALSLGRWVTVVTDGGERGLSPRPMVHFRKKVGRLFHIAALPPVVAGRDEKETSSVVVLAWEGDLELAVGEYLARRFALPREWAREYASIFHVEELEVLSSPDFPGAPRAAKVGLPWQPWALHAEGVDRTVSEALRSGRLRVPSSAVRGKYEEGMTLKEYLKANARIFAVQLAQVKPLHDPERDRPDPAVVMERVPFPAQAHAAAGLLKALDRYGSAVACGDMGTGKSIVALAVANALYRRKGRPAAVLLTAPAVTVPKWIDHEIGQTLPEAKVWRIANAEEAAKGERVLTGPQFLNMARAGYRPQGLEFVVLSIDRAKLGPAAWWGSALWKRIVGEKGRKGWHCPDCGTLLTKVVQGETLLLAWEDFAAGERDDSLFTACGLPKKGVRIEWRRRPVLRKCPKCGAALLRPALKSRGETNQSPRWYAALALKKLGRYFDLYIADEVHQAKAEESGRGFAFAQLVRCARKVLCLTGTLVNGMSTSVKEILWRTDAKALLADGFDAKTGAVAWAARYGVLEHVERVDEGDEGIVTRRRRYRRAEPRERPGISPVLVAKHLLHKGVFMELQDLGLPLVRLEERPVLVNLDEEHMEMYKDFHNRLRAACVAAYVAGKKGAFARFIPATINAVDRADLPQRVEVDGVEVRFEGLGPGRFTAKELRLAELVRESLAEGRGVMVYAFYTDRYGVHHRIRRVLEEHGLGPVAVLESSVSPEGRVEWLAEQAGRGTKVLVCNMRLVEVGLDLLPWPTIIFYQLSYDAQTVRQASRRAWRIGQSRECRVCYLVAEGTQQAAQFRYVMEKRAHAMLAEGRLDRSELGKYVSGTRMGLAADIAECMADDAAEKWVSLAEKDVDVATVSEAEFARIIADVQGRLARETLRLCGLESEEVEVAEEVRTAAPSYADLAGLLPRRVRRKRVAVHEGQLTLFDLLAVSVTPRLKPGACGR